MRHTAVSTVKERASNCRVSVCVRAIERVCVCVVSVCVCARVRVSECV